MFLLHLPTAVVAMVHTADKGKVEEDKVTPVVVFTLQQLSREWGEQRPIMDEGRDSSSLVTVLK
jgi:hypothetical protein